MMSFSELHGGAVEVLSAHTSDKEEITVGILVSGGNDFSQTLYEHSAQISCPSVASLGNTSISLHAE
jgi:hypothetical protein